MFGWLPNIKILNGYQSAGSIPWCVSSKQKQERKELPLPVAKFNRSDAEIVSSLRIQRIRGQDGHNALFC